MASLASRTRTQKFLSGLFPSIPDNTYIQIWAKHNKKTAFFDNPSGASDYACKMAEQTDVYTGVSLSPRKIPAKSEGEMLRVDQDGPHARRCPKSHVAAIGGLWIDLDIQAPHRESSKNYPPDEDHANRILDEFSRPPSILVHSGHGLHAWWLFQHLWSFTSSEGRERAQKLTMHFNQTAQTYAAESGYDLDSTHDLARIMRIPGTINHSGDEPKPVRTLQIDTGRRYTPEELRDICTVDPDLDLSDTGAAVPVDLSDYDFELTKDLNPPTEKWQALQAVDEKVQKAWEHKRTDLADQSASGYDMSLATHAAYTEWSDQEIVSLLVAHRRKYDENLNLDRPDYYARTIKKARKSAQSLAHKHDVQNLRGGEEEEEEKDVYRIEGTVDEKLETVSEALNIPITKLVKFEGGTEPRYALKTKEDLLFIGSIKNLDNQTLFRRKMMNAHNKVIRNAKGGTFKKPRWYEIVQVLLDTMEVRDAPDSITPTGQFRTWVEHYLYTNNVPSADEFADDEFDYNWKERAFQGLPYRNEKGIWMNLENLRTHVINAFDEKMAIQQLADYARASGFEYQKTSIRLYDRKKSLRVWKINPNWWE